jgi:hypothetical protein
VRRCLIYGGFEVTSVVGAVEKLYSPFIISKVELRGTLPAAVN